MGVRGRRHCSGSFDFNENTHASQHKGAEAGPQLVRELMNQRLEKSMFSGEIINHGEALPLILCWLTWPQIGCDPSSRLRGKLCRGLVCWMPCCRLWQWRTKKFSKVFLICLCQREKAWLWQADPRGFKGASSNCSSKLLRGHQRRWSKQGKRRVWISRRGSWESCVCVFSDLGGWKQVTSGRIHAPFSCNPTRLRCAFLCCQATAVTMCFTQMARFCKTN